MEAMLVQFSELIDRGAMVRMGERVPQFKRFASVVDVDMMGPIFSAWIFGIVKPVL